MIARPLLALLLVSGLLLAGCKDDERTGADPGEASTSPTTEGTATGSPSTDGTAPQPADGPLIEDEVFSLHLPAEGDWELRRGGLSATAYDEDFDVFDLSTSTVPLQAGDTGEDIDFDFETSTGGDSFDQPLRRGKNRVLDGVEGWTAETVDDGQLVYAYGGMHARHAVKITFSFPKKDPRSRAWIEATLASLQWK
ncbi:MULTISPECIES: hypothetical protein [unclassified Nocardioides]|uniref:hypothetical protein n=1 Tax=unclassified Nocardioides TaxID=2615069 RepID=UPI0006FF8887|nr:MULTISPECIES: hypothetical protein [unclassified Nocardioides]KRA31286.1 hypothetical protein ASD81_17725 [Nocardioides sp. Root614]KRA87907.1 hypothetical protein ASD84_18000 [Nocardioides sp. Root682]